VPRQNVGQEKGKSASATAALTAIGTEHPLASQQLTICRGGVIAAQKAVPVQHVGSTAVRARPLLERKNCDFSPQSSRAKQKSECGIRLCCLSTAPFVEHFFTALFAAQLD